MDLREVTTFLSLQCLPPLQQHDRELAFFLLAVIRMSPATIAKNQGMSRMTAKNSKERKKNTAATDRIPKKNVQNVHLATKRTTRRNGVGKALEPTSSPKTLRWRTPNKTNRPPAKVAPTINKQLLS